LERRLLDQAQSLDVSERADEMPSSSPSVDEHLMNSENQWNTAIHQNDLNQKIAQ